MSCGEGRWEREKKTKRKKKSLSLFFVWQHRRESRQAAVVLAGTVGLFHAASPAFALRQAGPGLLLLLRGLETMLLLSEAGCD